MKFPKENQAQGYHKRNENKNLETMLISSKDLVAMQEESETKSRISTDTILSAKQAELGKELKINYYL